jgi:hypothetical protein
MKSILLLSTVLSILLTSYLSGQINPLIEYINKTPEGLVGNGKSVVKVNPVGFQFHTGGSLSGKLILVVDGSEHFFN